MKTKSALSPHPQEITLLVLPLIIHIVLTTLRRLSPLTLQEPTLQWQSEYDFPGDPRQLITLRGYHSIHEEKLQ